MGLTRYSGLDGNAFFDGILELNDRSLIPYCSAPYMIGDDSSTRVSMTLEATEGEVQVMVGGGYGDTLNASYVARGPAQLLALGGASTNYLLASGCQLLSQ